VLGDDFVDAAPMTSIDRCSMLMNVLGRCLGPRGLLAQDRSMPNLAMISVLNRPHELRAHIRGRCATA
jgi:4-carboxymuconolactone decarboxylase